MFERYTEKARRVVFFSRYEASQYGSPYIETEHLLLGYLRECKDYRRWAPDLDVAKVRSRIDAETPKRSTTATSVDLALSHQSTRALALALLESERLAHKYIGTEHLLLGLIGIENSFAAKLLREGGADAEKMRRKLATEYHETGKVLQRGSPYNVSSPRAPVLDTVEIHGARHSADFIHDVVSMVRSYNWHWHKADWRTRDIVIQHKDGKVSFDLTLAEDKENFTLVKQGWKKDRCFVCRWELFESEGEHGVGYSNGRNWLCVECCERFVLGSDFFASSQSEMT